MLKHVPCLHQDKKSAFQRPGVNISVPEKYWGFETQLASS